MSDSIDTLIESEVWEVDLEVEILPTVLSATLPIVVAPPFLHNGFTTVLPNPI